MTELSWVACSVCGAISLGAPPHGQGQACPQRLKTDEAYIQMLDAQRMSYLRSAGSMEDIARVLRKDEEE